MSIAILESGLVTSVGLSAPAACAAMRAGLASPSQTRFTDSDNGWRVAHQVHLSEPWQGRRKLTKMACLAIAECLKDVASADWPQIPLLLCVAEPARPGRLEGLDQPFFADVRQELGVDFSDQSRVIPHGRVSIGVALSHARRLLSDPRVPHVLIAASDSLLNAVTLIAYDRGERLLTDRNANGFIPGEGAGALLVGRAGQGPQLRCTGLGFGVEPAHIDSENPLRADGLTQAINGALQDARCDMSTLDFRVTDISGEHYYFKEAALALSRTLRVRKEEFDIWHPAECIGETGAVVGVAMLALANAACRKGFAHGPNILCHAANDDGQRCALIMQFGAAS